ncbi:MAG: 3-oxoacyl-ACP synthase [Candidatus Marinimicrobia bacterium]|nr:3-oxoacyl-ACP synthase [Candidatus Neomarinimicrobiota bacterium]|tara:strand:- start:23077 stop:24039 length:963 start_codon:yes stop_codon:yes gene_type:complete
MKIKISGIGYYLPENIETSEELAPKIGKSVDWIISRTGVKERRVSNIDVDLMGAKASKLALKNEVPDLILNASGVGKQVIPDTSVFIQKELGFKGIPSFTIHSTCLSFLVALNTAANFISQNTYKKILIVSSDRGARGRNFNEPESAALLGDAAAAVLVERSLNDEESCMLDFAMNTYPEGSHLTEVRGGGTNLHPHDKETSFSDNLFTMNGPMIYKMARKTVYNQIQLDLENNNLNINDIDLVVPHQASGLAVKAYSKYGGFSNDKVVNIIDKTGNCVAASLPLALALAYEQDKIKRGDLIYFIGTGAGLSVASCLLRF